MNCKYLVLLFLLVSNIAFSAEFFASNNTQEITVQSAYARLAGQPQIDLKKSIIQVFKKYNIKEIKSGSILGAYQMSTDKDMTADNTEYVVVNSSQPVFSIAKSLAIKLHQDSIAVFIPNKSTVGDISVNFAHPLTINDAITKIRNQLPASYSQGFSLHLINTAHAFDKARVTDVEWLGSKLNIKDIQQAFPTEKVNAQDGTAYLIYQDGRKEKL